jgi:hypothetical protein
MTAVLFLMLRLAVQAWLQAQKAACEVLVHTKSLAGGKKEMLSVVVPFVSESHRFVC